MVTTGYPCEFKERNLDASAQFDIVRSFWTKKTLQRIRREFYWFEMREDVEVQIQRCDVCTQSKLANRKPKAPLGSIPVGGPLDCVATDIVGHLPRNPRGNRYILTVTDSFTKWLEVYPIPDQTAETCAAKFQMNISVVLVVLYLFIQTSEITLNPTFFVNFAS